MDGLARGRGDVCHSLYATAVSRRRRGPPVQRGQNRLIATLLTYNTSTVVKGCVAHLIGWGMIIIKRWLVSM